MSGKGVAIVTGGAQGIGAAIVTALLDYGYKVCVADVKEEVGREFVGQLTNKFGNSRIQFTRCDVTLEDDFRKTFDHAAENLGQVNLLVNNAGIVDERNPKITIDVNVMGPIYGCRVALERMGKSKGGEGGIVINTASISGLVGSQYYFPVYVASKHAVIGLTRSYGMPYHFEEEGILFCALCPSFTKTPLLQLIRDQTGMDESQLPEMMSPEYVAKGLIKLLEDKINGSTLLVSKEDGYTYIGYQKDLEKHLV